MRKVCNKCGVEKDPDDYYNHSTRTDGKQAYCKDCHNAANKKWKDSHSESWKAYANYWQRKARQEQRDRWLVYEKRHRLNKFGWSEKEYDALLAEQCGVCAICKQPETTKNRRGVVYSLAIDHSHLCCPPKKSCKKCRRGLLCGRCNKALHMIDVYPGWAHSAATYLDKYRGEA